MKVKNLLGIATVSLLSIGGGCAVYFEKLATDLEANRVEIPIVLERGRSFQMRVMARYAGRHDIEISVRSQEGKHVLFDGLLRIGHRWSGPAPEGAIDLAWNVSGPSGATLVEGGTAHHGGGTWGGRTTKQMGSFDASLGETYLVSATVRGSSPALDDADPRLLATPESAFLDAIQWQMTVASLCAWVSLGFGTVFGLAYLAVLLRCRLVSGGSG